jgi:DNA-binding response OmpR family regulator
VRSFAKIVPVEAGPVDPTVNPTDPFHILIVEDDADVREAIGDAITASTRTIHHADSVAAARDLLDRQPIDLVLIDVGLPDGDGIAFAGDLQQTHPLTHAIVVTGHASVDRAVEAMRVGVVDFLSKPLNINQLNQSVGDALNRQRDHARREQRLGRLRRLCKQLNQARHEITQQVDILCNDLVTAYQELANQVQSIELTGDLRSVLTQELDLEQVLRRTLEFILQRIGPTNAVVFLPGKGGGYTVGGYVNYSFDKGSARVLLQQLAEVAGPAIAEDAEPVHLADPEALGAWLDADLPLLDGQDVLAAPCLDEDEDVLALLMLFRDAGEPFDHTHVDILAAICPVLARHLVKVIHIHHRAKDLFEEEDADDLPF